MRKIIFIFSILLSSLCASLAQGQTYTVTWKVKGKTLTGLPTNSTQVKSGNKVLTLPPQPTDACEKNFVGWTMYENYEAIDAPSDLFINRTQSPKIYSNVTFHAVFADEMEGSFFDYTTGCCTEILFVEGIVSLDDAKEGKVLFIKNPDPEAKIFNLLAVDKNNANPNWSNNVPRVFFEDGWTYFEVSKPGYYMVHVYRAADDTYCEVDKYVGFNVVDSCTIEYVGFDDNWCDPCSKKSQGGRHKLGDTFIIPTITPTDPEGLNRELIIWNTAEHYREFGDTYTLGSEIIVTEDLLLYPHWEWNITEDMENLDYSIPNTDITINAGATCIVNEFLEINSLTFKGGFNNSDSSYAMPNLYIDEFGLLIKYNTNNIVNFDLSINSNNYYPFAVPFPVAVGDIDYADSTLASPSTYGTHYVIKRYDGAARAINGEDRNGNWVVVDTLENLQPGVGYIITALPVDGKAIIRIPLEFTNDWTIDGEQSAGEAPNGDWLERNIISTTAYSGTAANADPIHAGWNFIANPYLAKYDGSQIQNAPEYASIPTYNFSEYQQVPLSDVTLSPEYPFFVQVNSNTELNFATEGRKQAPAAMRTSDDKLRTKLTITQHNNNKTDQTSIILGDSYSPAYEINADLEKMFGSAYTTAIYTCSQNTRLAFNALSWQNATSPIPLGYRAAEVGEYTIALDNIDNLGDIASVNLHDAYTNQTINLLYFDYTFNSEVTQDDSRFTIQITSKNNTTTDIDSLIVPTTTTTKIIHNNQLYIIHDGQKYNAIGQAIK